MAVARAILKDTARSVDLHGRITRADCLRLLAFWSLVFVAVIAIAIWLLPAEKAVQNIYVTTALFYLPVTAAAVRRLRDVGGSGMLMLDPLKSALTFGVVLLALCAWASLTVTGVFVTVLTSLFFASSVVALALIGLLFVLVCTAMHFSNTTGLLLLPSSPGPNRYGPNPHEVSS